MERLYQIIARRFSQGEITDLASILSVYVPANSEPTAMARELFLGARRNLRLDVLFSEVYRYKPSLNLDLGANLYELVAGTFNEDEAAELTRTLGFDQLKLGLDADGLIGWNNDNFYKRQKAELIQKTAVEQGKFEVLLEAMKAIRPNLDLTAFKLSALAQAEPQHENKSTAADEPKAKGLPEKGDQPTVVYNIYGDHVSGNKVGGDQVGGDKIGGDKAGGDIIKGVSISGNTDSAIAIGSGSTASVTNNTTTINQPQNRDDLLNLINQINQELDAIKSELHERDLAEAAETLEAIEQEIKSEKPNVSWVARKLKNVSEIAETVTTATQVAANIGLAIQAVQALFGG